MLFSSFHICVLHNEINNENFKTHFKRDILLLYVIMSIYELCEYIILS